MRAEKGRRPLLPQQNYDSFQQQLNDLQRSYTQLGKTFPQQLPQQGAKREVHYEDGLEEAKKWSKENLRPGDAENIFDRNENLFYCFSRREDGAFNPVILGRFTLEQEPPKPEYATKQDFEQLRKELVELLQKGATT